MSAQSIIWPLLVQILFTLLLYIPLLQRKTAAAASNQIDVKKAAVDASLWTEPVQLVNNNLRNQFETPLLFMALCLYFYSSNSVTVPVLVLAWAYVITRLAHCRIHITRNYVPHRMRWFAGGLVILLVLTLMAGATLI